MGERKENTAATAATLRTDSAVLTNPWFPDDHLAEQNWTVTMSIFKKMRKNGLICSEEYKQIDTMMAKKYGSYLSDLYR